MAIRSNARLKTGLISACLVLWLSATVSVVQASETLTQLSVNPHRHLITAQLSKAVSSTVHHRVQNGRLQVIWDLEGVDVSPGLQGETAWLESLQRQWPDLISATVARFSGPVLRFRFDFKDDQLIDPVVMQHDTPTPYLAFTTQKDEVVSGGPRTNLSRPQSPTMAMVESLPAQQANRPPTFSETMAQMHGHPAAIQRYQTFTSPSPASAVNSPYSASVLRSASPQVIPTQQVGANHLAGNSANNTQLQQQVNELSRKVAYWQEKYQTVARQEQPEREKKAFELGLQLNKTRQELSALQHENQQLNTQLQAMMNNQAQQTEAYTGEQQQRITQLQRDNERLQGQISRLQTQLASSSPSKTDESIAAVAVSSVPAHASDSSQLKALKTALEQSKQSLLKSIQTINRQNQAIARLNEQLTDVKEGIGQSSLEQQTYLNDQLTKAEAQQDELEKTVQRLELENRSLKLVVNGLQKKLPEGATQDVLSKGGLPDLPIEEAGDSAWTSKHMDNAEQQQQLDSSTRLRSQSAVYTATPAAS